MNHKIISPLLVTLAVFIHSLSFASPKIVTSIQPLQTLAAGVTKDITVPVALLPASASPHHYSLSPSQIKSLNEADLIIWVGPELENFLAKPIHIIKSQPKTIITLLEQPTINKLPLREGKNWNDDEHNEKSSSKNKPLDPHIWLSIDNAIVITDIIANELMTIDVENAHAYDTNRNEQIKKLNELKIQLNEQLNPLQKTPYFVFHDGYQYFEKEFKLNAVGAVAIHPERPISAKRLSELHDQIILLKPVCIFSEPQFKPKIVKPLIAGTSIKMGELDAYGTELIEPTYAEILEFNAKHLVKCLGNITSSTTK